MRTGRKIRETVHRMRRTRIHHRTWGAVALLVILAGHAAGCTGIPRGVEPITGFEPERYTGEWYAIKRLDHPFERGLTDVTARYELLENGHLRVVNRGYDPKAEAWQEIEGTAQLQGEPDQASLTVTFTWPIRGGYHVIALDKADYEWAMVSGPTRSYLWILAREPSLDEEILDDLLRQAEELGYPVEDLQRVTHGRAKQDGHPDNATALQFMGHSISYAKDP
ncbi:MAG: lipocalin family protein [Halorhodospira sp.]